ncbi:hypothetical protein EW146_g10310 [Bondarzewia mesenterica]|uniref:Uncharacterized protein n=1 Tax=Bondarzewia mesenterica TaxID=1095465 RepID=A0A4S4L384_9AGAM|nr:hypothetical protein EW146_g10310 [Bondarzewia mesenterica]
MATEQTITKLQYAAASHVPLIQSPSLRVPRPVELPPDIHPLPDSVTAYFAYPFTLEPHITLLESSRRQTIAAHAARREALLRAREDEKERRKREALRRIAPGFEPRGTPLVPTKMSPDSAERHAHEHEHGEPSSAEGRAKDVMEDLVDGLAALDSKAL